MSKTRMCNISGFHHGRDLSCGFLKYNTVRDDSKITVPVPRPRGETAAASFSI